MEIRKLEAFCRVVELKSFTRAAKIMLLSQPTVSEQIRNLEIELDQKLLDRLGREAVPTPAGAVLYNYAVKILKARDAAIQAMQQYGGRMVGRIVIGCGTIPGTYILPQLISEFRRIHPSIQAALRITSSRIIAEKVLSGEHELGLIGAKWNENGLDWSPMFSDELTLAVHPEHPLAGKKSVPLDELCKHPFIMREPESGTRKVIARILERSSLQEKDLQEAVEIGSTAAVKEAVKAGLGISILSNRAVRDDTDCGKLQTVSLQSNDLHRSFYLIQRKNRQLSPVASVFLDFIQQRDAAAKNKTDVR